MMIIHDSGWKSKPLSDLKPIEKTELVHAGQLIPVDGKFENSPPERTCRGIAIGECDRESAWDG